MQDENKKEIDALTLIDKIIAATFARSAGQSEDEFLESIGLKEHADEDTEVRNARFTLIWACMKELLKAVDKTKLIVQTMMIGFGITEEQLQEYMKKDKEKKNASV